VLSYCSLDNSLLLLVSHLFFDADINDPPSFAMLACGLATILPFFLRGCDVVNYIHKMMFNFLLMWSFPFVANTTISKHLNYG